MEDLFKFLPLIAIIAAAIWKEARKNKAKQEATQGGTPPRPQHAGDAIPLPEAWGKIFGPEELLNPKPIENPAKKPTDRRTATQPKKKEKIQKIENNTSFVANHHVALDGGSTCPDTSAEILSSDTDSDSEFTIHSAEEARRAIIWGEILQRKY